MVLAPIPLFPHLAGHSPVYQQPGDTETLLSRGPVPCEVRSGRQTFPTFQILGW